MQNTKYKNCTQGQKISLKSVKPASLWRIMVIDDYITHKRKEVSHMAIIPQQTLFVWSKIEALGDLERLQLVVEYMPDEELMKKLVSECGKSRNDYPVMTVWSTVLAGIVFQHISIERKAWT